MKRLILCLSPLLLALLLCGCVRYQDYPPDTSFDIGAQNSAVLESREVSVPSAPVEPDDAFDYRVGPGDVLSIVVAGLVERGGAAEVGGAEVKGNNAVWGFRVYSSGKVTLPLVGGVEVAGLSVEQVQQKLIKVYSDYIRQPVVSVEILQFKSQPIYLLGEFNQPGLYYLDRASSLLHGVSLGGGLKLKANLRGARVIRDRQLVAVDLYQLLNHNDHQQNIRLKPGDTVYVPNADDQKVYVLGAVRNPGEVKLVNGQLNLIQAMSVAGITGPYDHEKIRLIRTLSPTRGQLMVVDMGRMMDGQEMPLQLQDGDIVYVPKTKLGGWNDVIRELLPTAQLIGVIVQPFVWADDLNDNNN